MTFAVAKVNGWETGRLPVANTVVVPARDSVLRVGAKPGTEVPPVTNGAIWDAIARCESGNNWAINTGNGYYGGVHSTRTPGNDRAGCGMLAGPIWRPEKNRLRLLRSRSSDRVGGVAGVRKGGRVTIRLLGRTEIRNLAKELGLQTPQIAGPELRPRRQHRATDRLGLGVNKADHVLEVGPGLGSLTLALLDRGARVTAIEIDPVLAQRLPRTIAEHSHSEIHRLTVLNRDILGIAQSDLAEPPTAVVANLPYNIAVPALLHLLAEFPSIRTVMVMVQAEVAERLAAEPGGKGVRRAQRQGAVLRQGPPLRHGVADGVLADPRVYSGLVRIDRYETSAWPTDAGFRERCST